MGGFFRFRKHWMPAVRQSRVHPPACSNSFQVLIALFFVLLLLSACGRLTDNSSESGDAGEELSGEAGIADNTAVTPAQAAMGDWVPFKVDDSPLNPLSPYVLPGLSDIGVQNPSPSLSPSSTEFLITPEEISLGVPADFPVNLVPLLKVASVYEGSVENDYAWIQFESGAAYEEALEFYRAFFSDKPRYEENTESDGEVTLYANILGWKTSLRIMDNGGNAYMELDLDKE